MIGKCMADLLTALGSDPDWFFEGVDDCLVIEEIDVSKCSPIESQQTAHSR